MEHISIKVKPDKKNNKATITLNGDLVLEHLETKVSELISTLNKYDSIDLQVNKVESVDLTLVQLIDSFRETAAELNKKFNLEIELSDNQWQLMEKTGLKYYLTKHSE